jgi:2-oxo-3-hexenedioate decarboxylase
MSDARRGSAALADELLRAADGGTALAPFSQRLDAFDLAHAYEVLNEISARRHRQGWRWAGRKLGYTNKSLWPRYHVTEPFWAPMWTRTVHTAVAHLPLAGLSQPRIEPEVVFRLRGPVPLEYEPERVLASVEWLAAGFELVQSPYPLWQFRAPDAVAAFGLHGALVVGEPLPLAGRDARELARRLETFTATLFRGAERVDSGVGANVLGSPLRALVELARLTAGRADFPPLAPGELITTGTITAAWPVGAGETWRVEYGELGLAPLTLCLR